MRYIFWKRNTNILKQIFMLNVIFGNNLIEASLRKVFYDRRINHLIISVKNLSQLKQTLLSLKNLKKFNNEIINKNEKLLKNNFYLKYNEPMF